MIQRVKCPYVLKNCNPFNFIDNLSTKQRRDNCCVKDNQGNLRVKNIHKYYYHIPMQLPEYLLMRLWTWNYTAQVLVYICT